MVRSLGLGRLRNGARPKNGCISPSDRTTCITRRAGGRTEYPGDGSTGMETTICLLHDRAARPDRQTDRCRKHSGHQFFRLHCLVAMANNLLAIAKPLITDGHYGWMLAIMGACDAHQICVNGWWILCDVVAARPRRLGDSRSVRPASIGGSSPAGSRTSVPAHKGLANWIGTRCAVMWTSIRIRPKQNGPDISRSPGIVFGMPSNACR